MTQKGNWTEKDEATIQAIVVNMINQKSMFKDLGEKGELYDSFKIKNSREYILGLFTGIVINLFANYWIGEHEAGLLPDDLNYLYHKISSFEEEILHGLFE
ncbi:MAG: hypothetical protein GTN35_03420 [Nitrososphaeria archaeon]|nr:hypothetical protein [Nitrosopumilaceae archaeon]NIP09065.1 hypothetical protein [Nitrosopumilaceae archaeon]NIP91434.1 hypothetical protein [Nitrososphaeria archaeon]NIS95261.1 hypothetical protein [Nitrosopumilaceae archaeon]